MNIEQEIYHLTFGAAKGENAEEGVGLLIFQAECIEDADLVLKKAKEVLQIVLQNTINRWPENDTWLKILPDWFISVCATERTPEQVEKDLAIWQTLSSEDQQRMEDEESWSVLEWLEWFEPTDDKYSQRMWFWWDSWTQGSQYLFVAVEVLDLPLPLGAFMWLLRAAGARNIREAIIPNS
jgi:hypothetical protein